MSAVPSFAANRKRPVDYGVGHQLRGDEGCIPTEVVRARGRERHLEPEAVRALEETFGSDMSIGGAGMRPRPSGTASSTGCCCCAWSSSAAATQRCLDAYDST